MPAVKLSGASVVELAQRSEELEFYIEWLAMPRSERPEEIRSQEKVAAHLGVTTQTLRNWKRDPRVQSRVDQLRTSKLRIEDLPDVFKTLFDQATDPQNPRSVAAAKLLIEQANRMIDDAATANELKGLSNKELRDMAAALYDEIDERVTGA